MAEVRLRFGREVHKLLKSAYVVTVHKGNKYGALSVQAVPMLSGTPLLKSHGDGPTARESCNRPACHQGDGTRSVTAGAGLYACQNSFSDEAEPWRSEKLSALLQTASLCLVQNVAERVTVCNRRDAGSTGPRTWINSLAQRNGLVCNRRDAGSTGPRTWINSLAQRNGLDPLTRSFHARHVYGVSSRVKKPSCGCLTRAYSGAGAWEAQDTPLFKSKRAYYDILEVSPTASQAQIKTAYYKQSFIYHPDKNAGSGEATFRFSQISEAYNVLGNKALRRKYDRGILSHADVQSSSRPSSAKEAPSRPSGQQTRARHSPVAGRHPETVFDFDAFYRAHYGEQLQREKFMRARREEIQKKKKKTFEDWKLAKMTEVVVGMLLATAVAILITFTSIK